MPTHSDRRTAEAFRACADPNRLRLMLAIAEEPGRNVGALRGALDAPEAVVCRHLAALRYAGLVVSRPAGRFREYTLAPRAWFLVDAARGLVAFDKPVTRTESTDPGVNP